MEYLGLYDKNGNDTGEKIIRTHDKKNVPEGKYIKLVLIFIKNSEDKFLFQLTSKEKDGKIATTGGHVQAGQSSIEAIYAEVSEELGIDIKNDNMKFIGSYFRGCAIVDVYYLEKDLDINNLTLQKEEVDSVNWYTVLELENLIEKDTLRKGNIDGLNMILDYLKRK